MIGGCLVHAHLLANPSAPEVAASDDDGYIHPHFAHFFHPPGNILCLLCIDAFTIVVAEGFAAQF
jgi:hypothetical protein